MTEIVYGHHPIYHLISCGRRKVFCLYLQKGGDHSGLQDLARKNGIKVSIQEPAFFSKTAGPNTHHQGVLCETEPYPYVEFEKLLSQSFLVILDEIQDTQNLGAICRSAHLFGVGGMIIPETHAASVNAGVCQASVGAVEYLQIARVSSVAKVLEVLKENQFWVYGADMQGKPLNTETFPAKKALVIGSEEKGMRRLVKERCDILLRIPVLESRIDSLNASVAAGVFFYELSKGLKKQ